MASPNLEVPTDMQRRHLLSLGLAIALVPAGSFRAAGGRPLGAHVPAD